MTLSDAGLAMLKSFESCRLTAYQDEAGIWTIGWGATGLDILPTTVWTQEEADAVLAQDVQEAEDAVDRLVTVPLTQNQFDALVDFCYNCGAGSLQHSTLLRLLNNGDYDGAAAQFVRWSHIRGVVNAGLLRRRQDERDLFLG